MVVETYFYICSKSESDLTHFKTLGEEYNKWYDIEKDNVILSIINSE